MFCDARCFWSGGQNYPLYFLDVFPNLSVLWETHGGVLLQGSPRILTPHSV
jgi:hypothetical protein